MDGTPPTSLTLRGVRLRVFPYEAVSEAIRQAGDFYEANVLDDLRALYPVQRTIVDVGANIGNHAAYWSAFVPHEAIVAFEPVPESFTLLRLNLRHDPSARLHRKALSDHRGLVWMAVDRVNMGRSRVAATGSLRVPCLRLDDVPLRFVSLIKVDVEGQQGAVLRGARRTIERWRPMLLVEDEEGLVPETLARLGLRYVRVRSWPGANHLWGPVA